ncbi:hypothetical protein [Vitiosangium sp. GDMCC 1.1324]|uniref:hypothetical protein n=1 Tax=Vitiosangium sp. (strain GDMCC 1.1324) TaxID=2138576 RepID=UPI0018EEC75D|nr:hypothetical protein [Vitiosangium sp. GDMCC 1.1324]
MRRTFLSLLPLCAVAACAGSRQGATAFEASYRPSETLPPMSLPTCAGPVQVAVSEGRKEPSIIVGQRFSEEAPNETYPIQMKGVVPYVQKGLERAFRRAGHQPAGSGVAKLDVAVTQFFLEEKMYYNSSFTGRVDLESAFTLPGSSQPCWTGRVSGIGENYGVAGSPENYQETFSAAMDRAAAQLFEAPGFADALCGRCSGVAPQQAPAPVAPAQQAPAPVAPAQQAPAPAAPPPQAPAPAAPAQQAPAPVAPPPQAPAPAAPAQQAPASDAPAQQAPASDAPAQPAPQQ